MSVSIGQLPSQCTGACLLREICDKSEMGEVSVRVVVEMRKGTVNQTKISKPCKCQVDVK